MPMFKVWMSRNPKSVQPGEMHVPVGHLIVDVEADDEVSARNTAELMVNIGKRVMGNGAVRCLVATEVISKNEANSP